MTLVDWSNSQCLGGFPLFSEQLGVYPARVGPGLMVNSSKCLYLIYDIQADEKRTVQWALGILARGEDFFGIDDVLKD